MLRSSVADGGAEGPLFNVTLVPSHAGHEPAVRLTPKPPAASMAVHSPAIAHDNAAPWLICIRDFTV